MNEKEKQFSDKSVKHRQYSTHTHTHTHTHTEIQCPAYSSATNFFAQRTNHSNLTVLSKTSKGLSNKNLFFWKRNIYIYIAFSLVFKNIQSALKYGFPLPPPPPPKRNVNQNEMKIKSLNYFSSPFRSTRSANTWVCSLKTFNIKPESTICSGYGTLD